MTDESPFDVTASEKVQDKDLPMIKVIAAEQGQRCTVLGSEVCLKLTGNDTHGRLALVEYLLQPGQDTGCQIHAEEDKTLYILEGEIELHTGEERLRAGVGTILYLPRHLPHRFQAGSDRPCRLLMAIIPAGLELYYRECERLAAEEQAERDQIVALSAEYGIRLM